MNIQSERGLFVEFVPLSHVSHYEQQECCDVNTKVDNLNERSRR